jgi:hypothetical protein
MKKRSLTKNRADLRRFKERQERMAAAREEFLNTGIGDLDHSMYVVDISYPLHVFNEPEDPTRSLRKVARPWRGKEIGSGAGFGRRDVAFAFQTLIEAIAFLGDVERAKNPFVKIDAFSAQPSDDDDIPLSDIIEGN